MIRTAHSPSDLLDTWRSWSQDPMKQPDYPNTGKTERWLSDKPFSAHLSQAKHDARSEERDVREDH